MLLTEANVVASGRTLQAEHLATLRPAGAGNWSPAGDQIAYFWSDETGRTRLYVARVDGSTSWHLTSPLVVPEPTDGTDRRDLMGGPQWSPRGDRIAFTAVAQSGPRKAIWTLDVATRAAAEVVHVASDDRTPRWSPDGSAIAFVGNRDGHDELEVARAGDRVPTQLTYGRWDTTDPDWSPDGQWLAYVSQRSDEDLWAHSLCKVPLAGGRPQVLTGTPLSSDRSPRWSPAADWIAFISNRDGGDNVWIIRPDGSDLRQLTHGTAEKADPRWSPDGSWILYTCFRDCDLDIVAVPTAGGEPRLVVTGEACQFPRWSPDGTRILYHRSGYATPGDLWIKDWGSQPADPGVRVTDTAGNQLDGIEFVKPSIESYRGRDGLEIQGLLWRGSGESNEPGPAMLYVRGGPNSVTTTAWSPQIQFLAQRGYTIFAPNYRGSTGYGKSFMEANRGHVPGADVEDWLAAGEYLRALPEVDPERVGIMGRSYGGYATMLMLGLHPDEYRLGVATSGISDWLLYWDNSPNTWTRRLVAWLMDSPHANPAEHRARSPIHYAERYQVPILFIHGESDYGVTPVQSRLMAQELERLGKANECYVYPGEGHAFTGYTAIVDSNRRIERFLATHLSGGHR